MLDGVNTDGTAGYFDMGAVEEMIVRPAGNDPEIPTPGMAFQAIVKSGGNNFKGDGLYAWQGRSLQSNNIDDELRAAGRDRRQPDGPLLRRQRLLRRPHRPRQALVLHAARAARNTARKCWASPALRAPTASTSRADDEAGLQSDSETNLTGKVTAQLATKHRLSYMHHYDYKKTDNRGANAFRPHEATGFYTLPNHIARGEWLYTMNNRSVFNVSVGRSYWNSRAIPYTDNPPSFDNVTQRWLRRLRELDRRGLDAGRQPERALAVRHQLQLLPAATARRHARVQGRRVFHAGCLQQVPGSARRGHRRCRQRLPAVFLERRAVRSAALQLAVRGREHRQLSERLRARQLADRRAADRELRPARRALRRVPAGAVEAGRTVLRGGRLPEDRSLQLELLGAAPRPVLSADRPTTARSSRRPTDASTSRCGRPTRGPSATSTRTTTRPRAIAGTT